MTFEEFLKEKHARTYTGTDDAMPEAFDAWLEGLSVDEWIAYRQAYKDKEMEAARQEGCCDACEWIDYERDEHDRGIGLTSYCRNSKCECHTALVGGEGEGWQQRLWKVWTENGMHQMAGHLERFNAIHALFEAELAKARQEGRNEILREWVEFIGRGGGLPE